MRGNIIFFPKIKSVAFFSGSFQVHNNFQFKDNFVFGNSLICLEGGGGGWGQH